MKQGVGQRKKDIKTTNFEKQVVFWVGVGGGSKKHDAVLGGWQWLVDRFLKWSAPFETQPHFAK